MILYFDSGTKDNRKYIVFKCTYSHTCQTEFVNVKMYCATIQFEDETIKHNVFLTEAEVKQFTILPFFTKETL